MAKTVRDIMNTEVTTLGRNDSLQAGQGYYDARPRSPFSGG